MEARKGQNLDAPLLALLIVIVYAIAGCGQDGYYPNSSLAELSIDERYAVELDVREMWESAWNTTTFCSWVAAIDSDQGPACHASFEECEAGDSFGYPQILEVDAVRIADCAYVTAAQLLDCAAGAHDLVRETYSTLSCEDGLPNHPALFASVPSCAHIQQYCTVGVSFGF